MFLTVTMSTLFAKSRVANVRRRSCAVADSWFADSMRRFVIRPTELGSSPSEMEIRSFVDASEEESGLGATPATHPVLDRLGNGWRQKHPPLLVALALPDQGSRTVVQIELVDADAGNFSATKSTAEHQCNDGAVAGAIAVSASQPARRFRDSSKESARPVGSR